MAFMSLAMSAQVNVAELVKKSLAQATSLKELTEKMPKKTGNAEVDGFAQDVYTAAVAAMASSEKLNGFYTRQIGKTENGVTDVTVTKPSLQDWVELGTTVGAEVTSVAGATEKGTKATEEAKNVKNPLKAAKLAKMIKWTSDVMPILTDETANQAKAIKEIIATLKSGKNL